MREREDERSLKIALAAYGVVFVLKIVVYAASGVMALLAEAFHTLSDILVSGFLLLAAGYSRRAADQKHMFGYGRAQYVAALTAAVLFVSFTSYKLFEESIPRLLSRTDGEYRNLGLALTVLVLSMLVAAVPLVSLIRQRARGPAARAQLLESVNDELGLLAALLGTLFVSRGMPIADPIASIVVASIIAYNGIRLFLENLDFLLGRSPEPEVLGRMQSLARSVSGVMGIREIRAEYVGPEVIHAGMQVEVSPDITVQEADRIRTEIDQRIHTSLQPGYCLIQVGPAPAQGAPPSGGHPPDGIASP